MPERVDMILDLLQQSRDESKEVVKTLGKVETDIASIKEANAQHKEIMGDVRRRQDNFDDRLRVVEQNSGRVPDIESRLTTVRSDVSKIDTDVRGLQNREAGNQVTVSAHSQTWKYLGTAVGGALLTVLVKLVVG